MFRRDFFRAAFAGLAALVLPKAPLLNGSVDCKKFWFTPMSLPSLTSWHKRDLITGEMVDMLLITTGKPSDLTPSADGNSFALTQVAMDRIYENRKWHHHVTIQELMKRRQANER